MSNNANTTLTRFAERIHEVRISGQQRHERGKIIVRRRQGHDRRLCRNRRLALRLPLRIPIEDPPLGSADGTLAISSGSTKHEFGYAATIVYADVFLEVVADLRIAAVHVRHFEFPLSSPLKVVRFDTCFFLFQDGVVGMDRGLSGEDCGVEEGGE